VIGSYAFAHCHSIKEITIPAAVRIIDELSFNDYYEHKDCNNPEVVYIYADKESLTIAPDAFTEHTELVFIMNEDK